MRFADLKHMVDFAWITPDAIEYRRVEQMDLSIDSDIGIHSLELHMDHITVVIKKESKLTPEELSDKFELLVHKYLNNCRSKNIIWNIEFEPFNIDDM